MIRATHSLYCIVLLVALLAGGSALADVPYPACTLPACDPTCPIADAGCTGPDDYADYLFLAPGERPTDYGFDPENPEAGSGYVFEGVPESGPAAGVRIGHDIVGGWTITTGRPDVVVAILDSGINWDARDLALKVALNTGELPLPQGCPEHRDCDGNGVVNVADFQGLACPGGTVADENANGFLDAQDLIRLCSDGVDDDGNGYVDDIAGWDFQQDDNDPDDDVSYGHGTGEGRDQVAEANDGGGQPGVAPASMFVPLKVADSFVAIGSDFSHAVVYAVDLGVDLISEALGAVTAEGSGQQAIDYAYRRGIPIIASAADEQSRHHNMPAALDHTIWVNSVRPPDGDLITTSTPRDFTLQNGCTNHGGKAWVAIASKACSSEATGRAAGMVSLLIAHGRNLMDRGELSPYPGLDTPFSAEEVRQLLRQSALDIDQSGAGALPLTPVAALFFNGVLSDASQGLVLTAQHFDTQPGWDQYTGYGRPDMVSLLSLREETIPPEADLSGGPAWFDVVDPAETPRVAIRGRAAAHRAPGPLRFSLEVGCGVQPTVFAELASGMSAAPLEAATFHDWDPGITAEACGFDPTEAPEDPDQHTVTLRLRVSDSRDNVGEDRRTVAIHSDPALAYPPLSLGSSLEASPVLADIDGDDVLDIVVGSSGGWLHVLDGASGDPLPGFPVRTEAVPFHASPAYGTAPAPRSAGDTRDSGLRGSTAVEPPHEAILGSASVGDVDRDSTPEIAIATVEGGVYVFEHDGSLRPGFPVRTDPALSAPALRDRTNDLDPGISGAPTLADLDPPAPVVGPPIDIIGPDDPRPLAGIAGPARSAKRRTPSSRTRVGSAGAQEGSLEIVVGAWDGHVYAWRHTGQPVSGFPVKLADRSRVDVDPVTGRVTPASEGVQARLAKIVSSPAVGDLDGDGLVEIVVTTNEEYVEDGQVFDADSAVFRFIEIAAASGSLGDVRLDVASRIYALHGDGRFVEELGGEPAAWPARVPMLVSGLLPSIATGTPGSPAIADIDGEPGLEVAIFATFGPAVVFDALGKPLLPEFDGSPSGFAIDFPGTASGQPAPGFPAVPATAGSADAPFFPGLGSGAFGDIDGDGTPEYVAPTAGIRVLVDTLLPGSQEFSDHQIAAWHPQDGTLLPAFPRVMDDMQFLTAPALGDVSGDGVADVVNGSGAYLVRAYEADGTTPEGFPKFTHGWVIGTPAIGDIDGDGLNELVAGTREGRLFVWDTPGRSGEAANPWPMAGRDRRNTQNLSSGVPTTVPEPAMGAQAAALALLLGLWGRDRRSFRAASGARAVDAMRSS